MLERLLAFPKLDMMLGSERSNHAIWDMIFRCNGF